MKNGRRTVLRAPSASVAVPGAPAHDRCPRRALAATTVIRPIDNNTTNNNNNETDNDNDSNNSDNSNTVVIVIVVVVVIIIIVRPIFKLTISKFGIRGKHIIT